MAIQLETWEKSIGYVEWDAGGVICYTRLYVRYAMDSSTVARVYVRQVVATRDSGWTWSGTNNYYRTRCDGYYDSGYNKYASGWGHSETQVWSGSFTCTSSSWKSLQCYFATYGGTNYGETWTDVFVPEGAFASAPTGLSVSNVVRGIRDFSATVSLSGWGRGGSDSGKYRELQVWTYSGSGLVEPRRFQPQNNTNLSGTIVCSNSSAGSLNITPNTMYVIGAYASNGAVSTGSIRFGEYSTLADTLQSKSAETVDIHTIKINYTTNADGGKYAKKIQYSLDNSTWTNGATVSTGSSTSGSFNITGLKAGTQYTVYLRISTDAGITTSGSVTTKTKTACKIIRGNSVIEAIPYVIKPDGTKIELNVRRV